MPDGQAIPWTPDTQHSGGIHTQCLHGFHGFRTNWRHVERALPAGSAGHLRGGAERTAPKRSAAPGPASGGTLPAPGPAKENLRPGKQNSFCPLWPLCSTSARTEPCRVHKLIRANLEGETASRWSLMCYTASWFAKKVLFTIMTLALLWKCMFL